MSKILEGDIKLTYWGLKRNPSYGLQFVSGRALAKYHEEQTSFYLIVNTFRINSNNLDIVSEYYGKWDSFARGPYEVMHVKYVDLRYFPVGCLPSPC